MSPETLARETDVQKAEPGSGTIVAMPIYANADLRTLFVSRSSQNSGTGEEPTAPQTPELTPEMADRAIAALRAEFDGPGTEDREGYLVKDGYRVQKGMNFVDVERTLQAPKNAAMLLAVSKMTKPAVVCEQNGRYCIAETFGRTLPERANCVYDKAAEEAVAASGGRCNGNAVDQSRAMGIPLMEESIAKGHLAVPFSDTNQYCYDYLLASEQVRKGGCAPYLYRAGGWADVVLGVARGRDDYRGWRGALWVQS